MFSESGISRLCRFLFLLPSPISARLQRLAGHLFVAIVTLSLFACADLRVRVGARPDIAALEQSLTLGKSSASDVIAVLGQPSGRGKSLLPFEQTARSMWSYYYEEGTLQDDRRTFLFVFFDSGRYDGYMWFSSLPQSAQSEQRIESGASSVITPQVNTPGN